MEKKVSKHQGYKPIEISSLASRVKIISRSNGLRIQFVSSLRLDLRNITNYQFQLNYILYMIKS